MRIRVSTTPLLITACWLLTTAVLEWSSGVQGICVSWELRMKWRERREKWRRLFFVLGTFSPFKSITYTVMSKVYEAHHWVFKDGMQLNAGSCYKKDMNCLDKGTEMNNSCYWKKVVWVKTSPWVCNSVTSLALFCMVLWLIRAYTHKQKGFQLLHAFPRERFYWLLLHIYAAAPLSSHVCSS